MPIAFQGAQDLASSTATPTQTYSYTVNAASNLLVAINVGSASAQNITGITYAGAAMMLGPVLVPGAPGPNRYGTGWYLLNPATGANNLVVSNSGDFVIFGAADYSGVGAFETSGIQNGSGGVTSVTGTIATANAGDWIIAGTANDTPSGAPTAGAGLTLRMVDTSFNVWGFFDTAGAVAPGSNSVTANFPSTISGSGIWMMVFTQAVTTVFSDTGTPFDDSLAVRSGNERRRIIW